MLLPLLNSSAGGAHTPKHKKDKRTPEKPETPFQQRENRKTAISTSDPGNRKGKGAGIKIMIKIILKIKCARK